MSRGGGDPGGHYGGNNGGDGGMPPYGGGGGPQARVMGAPAGSEMDTRVYVGNLPLDCIQADIEDIFKSCQVCVPKCSLACLYYAQFGSCIADSQYALSA